MLRYIAGVIITLFLPGLLGADVSIESSLRRIESHLLIDDPASAVFEAELSLKKNPSSKPLLAAHIKSLARSHREKQALFILNKLVQEDKEYLLDRSLLEEVAWASIERGLRSSQHNIRLTSLIGAHLTQDARAIKALQFSMSDTNALVRSIAVQLASECGDEPLVSEIRELIPKEKSWLVKLSLIRSMGSMKMKDKEGYLRSILENERSSLEEKGAAIEALLGLYETISTKEVKTLSHSPFSGLRELACRAALYFENMEAKEDILSLLSDSNPNVRIAAINALTLLYKNSMNKEEIIKQMRPLLHDTDSLVAITAAWSSLICGLDNAQEFLEDWAFNEKPIYRRTAAAAISHAGAKGIPIAKRVLKSSFDPYVKANIAIGLIAQGEERAKSGDTLYRLLKECKDRWMFTNIQNTLFEALVPSEVRYIDQIPNYPEAVSQMSRLKLLNLLAILEDKRAKEALLEFLQEKHWGITGYAAVTLVQEGDFTMLEMVESLLDSPHPNVRLQAALVLAFFDKNEKVSNILQELYQKASHEHKLFILEAIGHIGKEESYSFLLNVMKEPFQVIRISAASSLIQCLHR